LDRAIVRVKPTEILDEEDTVTESFQLQIINEKEDNMTRKIITTG
jgi:hypothetical protein